MVELDQVLFLAAGRGTRLAPETDNTPKPLVKIGDQTLLDFSVEAVEDQLEIKKAVFVVGYLGEQIEQHVKKYDFVSHVAFQEGFGGQGHAIASAGELVDRSLPMLIVFPDSVWKFKNTDFINDSADVIVFAGSPENISEYGQLVCDENGLITRFVEKPVEKVSDLVASGIYYIRNNSLFMDYLDKYLGNHSGIGESYLAEIFTHMIDDGHKVKMIELLKWEDCGTLDYLKKLREEYSVNV